MLSIAPLFNASFIGFFLVGVFFWKLWFVALVGVCLVLSIYIYIYDCVYNAKHYASAFWLFIFSEVVIFGTLISCCLYFDHSYFTNLSNALEIPFFGCFLLLGSSITITAFHHLMDWEWSWMFLVFTITLGLSFVILQVYELDEVCISMVDSSFHACSFCTVGLHFSHVLLGVVGVITMLCVGNELFGFYRSTVITWYWHFVDYVWLFVYTFVYVCYYW